MDHHRARRVPRDLVARRPDQERDEAAVPAGADDDHLRVVLAGGIEERVDRLVLDREGPDFDVRGVLSLPCRARATRAQTVSASTAFAVCSRFSASSQTALRGP